MKFNHSPLSTVQVFITLTNTFETIIFIFHHFHKKKSSSHVSTKLARLQNYRLPSWPLTNCILLITRKSFRFRFRNSVYAEYTIVNTFTFEVPSTVLVFAIPYFGYFRLHLSGTQIKTLHSVNWRGGEIARTEERSSPFLRESSTEALMICNFYYSSYPVFS